MKSFLIDTKHIIKHIFTVSNS